MSSAKTIVFHRPLAGLAVAALGPDHLQGHALQAALESKYQEGYQAASDKFNAQILSMRQELQAHARDVLHKIEAGYQQMADNITAALPDLISAGVWKMIGQEAMPVEVLRSRVEAIVQESCPLNEPVDVKLNPQDLEELQKVYAEYASSHPRLKFSADANLKRGDCTMETKFGKVDATMQTQLRRLVEELSHT